MNCSSRIALGRACFLIGVLWSAGALAQDEGLSINRFDPAEHGGDWFVGESLDLRGQGRPALGLTLDYSHNPLVLYEADGDELAAIIGDQLYAHLGGGVVLWERVRLALNFPLLLVQSSETGALGGNALTASEEFSPGDLRLGIDLRLAGEYGGPGTLALGVQVHLPTGSKDAYAGDGELRVAPRLMLAGDIGAFAYSARFGFLYRGRDEGLASVPTGSELNFALTAGVRIAKSFLLGPELWGSTVVSDGDAVFKKATTPLELLFGAHYKSPDVLFSLGAGPGLTRGIGSPALRVVGSLAWFPVPTPPPEPFVEPEPPPPAADRDGDGIPDAEDACVDVAGVANADKTKHGCPPDRDGDGVPDEHDACPEVAGVANADKSKHGCPPDRDGDGVPDEHDACPDVPGEASDDPAKNGCPPDRDGDGIIDSADACPDAAGERHSDPQKNGCPLARVEQGQIKILERIEFKTDSAELLPASIPLLEAVLEVLNTHSEITRLSLEGHTDNTGRARYNLKLSQRRTDSVLKWLVKHGVTRSRLEAHGYGMTRPLDPSDTQEARDRNRRVEFHIREIDGKPIADEDASGSTP